MLILLYLSIYTYHLIYDILHFISKKSNLKFREKDIIYCICNFDKSDMIERPFDMQPEIFIC